VTARQIPFFAHDALNAAVKQRIKAFEHVGARVVGFTMRRGPPFGPLWENVDLGRTYDANFSQRFAALARAVRILARYRATLAWADVIYARNLDMLVLARVASSLAGGPARLVYECLDIHRFLTRANLVGTALRRIERVLLARAAVVVISSPAFSREYFDIFHPGRYRALLVENRLPSGFDYGPRPVPGVQQNAERSIRIGWFGNLRCARRQHKGPGCDITAALGSSSHDALPPTRSQSGAAQT